MPPTPVFIGGFRSGTTLLINLLGLHQSIAPWFETKELCEALRWMRVLRAPGEAGFEAAYCVPGQPAGFSPGAVTIRMQADVDATFDRLSGRRDSGKAGHEHYPVGHDCVAYSQAAAAAALREWHTAVARGADYAGVARATGALISGLGEGQCQALGRARWINKTPEISRFAPQLRDCLGSCRIIYMVRNGLDVVSSARRLGWGDVERLAYNWQGLLRRTRQAMSGHPDAYLELRYEDLLAEPARVLDEVLAFCGLPTAGAELVERFRALAGERAFERPRPGGPGELDAAERARFEAIAGAMQAELGYGQAPQGTPE